MSTSQERVNDVLDVATKPLQWLIGGIKLLLLGAVLVAVAIGTPIYMLCTGQSVTGDMVALAFVAILAVIAFFYTPYYFWFGGIATVFGIAWLIENHEGFVDAVVGRGLHFKLFVICWLMFGILRKVIWRSLTAPSKSISQQLDEFCALPENRWKSGNEQAKAFAMKMAVEGETESDRAEWAADVAAWDRREAEAKAKAQVKEAVEAEAAQTQQRQRAIPTTSDDSVNRDIQSLLAAARKSDCKSCEDAFHVLDVESGTDAASVKDAYRDLAKVWHPDRFGDGDTRLKKKAAEQFRKIHAAYAHLHEHQPPPLFDIEKMPLLDAVQSTTAANLEIARIGDSLLRWMKTGGLANLDEASLAMRQFLRMHQAAVSRLGRMIHRFERELPDYPRADLESMLDTTKKQRAQVAEVGASVGLNQPR